MLNFADFLQPTGALTIDMFDEAETDVEDRLSSYITQGYTQAVVLTAQPALDDAVRAWVYYRAYSAVADRLAVLPSSASLTGLGSVGISATSVNYFRSLAAQQRALFDQAVAVVLVADGLTPPPSAFLSTTVRW